MNKMKMPGFTAETSLYRRNRQYQLSTSSPYAGSSQIEPMLRGGNPDEPGGPPGAGDCLSSCMLECGDLPADACKNMCAKFCFPHGPNTGPNIPSFYGPCEVEWKDCLSSFDCLINPLCEAYCYGKWVYCKASRQV